MPPEGELMLPNSARIRLKYERRQSDVARCEGNKIAGVDRRAMDKSQAHAFASFLTRVPRVSDGIVSLCGKVKNKSQVHAFTSFLSSLAVGSVGSSHFVGKLRTKARYTLLLLFLAPVRGLDGIVSLCGKVKNKSQVHAFTSFLSSEPAGGHSRSDFAMPPTAG